MAVVNESSEAFSTVTQFTMTLFVTDGPGVRDDRIRALVEVPVDRDDGKDGRVELVRVFLGTGTPPADADVEANIAPGNINALILRLEDIYEAARLFAVPAV